MFLLVWAAYLPRRIRRGAPRRTAVVWRAYVPLPGMIGVLSMNPWIGAEYSWERNHAWVEPGQGVIMNLLERQSQ